MTIQSWTLLVAMIGVIFAVAVATIALLRCYFPPQTRAVMQLRDEVGEVQEDNDRLHARLNERAARDNMAKARATKVGKADALTEAQEVLRERLAAAKEPDAAAADPDAYRAALRRKHLQ